MSPRPAGQDERELQRQEILAAFEARARASGPRGVVMAELARDLGISTRTLYQHFGSKAEIVQEILGRWVAETEADRARRAERRLSAEAWMIDAAEGWLQGQDRFSAAFWAQIQADYPGASSLVAEQIRKSLAATRAFLAPRVRSDLDPELAILILREAVRGALDPKRCDRLGVSRQVAIEQSVELWCRGALRPGSD